MRHPEKLHSRLAMFAVLLCLFLFGTLASSAGVVRPLTDLKVDDTSNGVIAADGTVVFAGSNADPLGLNPMHGQQVFSWTLPGVIQAQVTTLLRGAGADSVSDDGAWVTAISRADPVGQNHDASQELFLISSDGSTIIQLTNDATFDGGTIWLSRISGSGNRVVFTSNRDPLGGNPGNYLQLFIVDADGSNLTQLTSAAADERFFSFSISDDGTRIVFDYSGDLTGGNADGTSEIFTVLYDATALNQKTTSATVDSFGPSLSGNGQLIVFVDTGGIRVMPWPSTNSLAIAAGEGPSITDDGKWLYYTAPDADNEEIFVVSASGGTPTQLTFTSPPLVNYYPVVSGGNVRLTFMVREGAYPGGSNSDGGTELMVMDVDGSNVVQLSNDVVTGGDAFPNMSPDGTRIVLASTGDLTGNGAASRGSREIFRIDDDGSNLTQVTTDAAVWHPTVTADGATIAFMSREDPIGDSTCGGTPLNPQIFSIQSEGTGLTPIVPVSNCTGADHPRISADGNFILLQSSGNFAGAGGSGAPLFRVPPEGGTVSLVVDDGDTLVKVPLLSDDGQWVVYHSAANVDGLNPDGSTEILTGVSPRAVISRRACGIQS